MKSLKYFIFLLIILLFSHPIYSKTFSQEEKEIYNFSPGLMPLSYKKIYNRIFLKNTYNYNRCGTPDFKNLYTNLNNLSISARKFAQKNILKRPTDYNATSDDFQFNKNEVAYSYHLPNNWNFLIHYSTLASSKHKVPDVYSLDSKVPDYVVKCAQIFESVFVKEVTKMGYSNPMVNASDGIAGGVERDKYDIYLLDVSPRRWFGYTEPETFSGNTRISSSYIVVDNDFTDEIYNNPLDTTNYNPGYNPLNNLRVTAAHEFFHAIQFSYDNLEEIWWDEASSVWMEEQVYNSINGYYYFLPDFFKYPWLALNRNPKIAYPASDHLYASGVFPIFLTEHYNVNIMKNIWENCALIENIPKDGVDESIKAIKDTLSNSIYKSSFEKAFSKFTIYNYFTSTNISAYNSYYPDEKYYPKIIISKTHNSYPINYTEPLDSYKPYLYGSNYILLNSENIDSNLEINFTGKGGITNWMLNLIKFDTSNKETIEEIPLYNSSGKVNINNFGSIYKKAILIPFLISGLDSSQYSYDYTARYINDVTPPNMVSNLKITSDGDSHAKLTWEKPQDNDFKGVKIIKYNRTKDLYESVLINFPKTNYSDFVLHNNNIFYQVYSYDEMYNYSFPDTTSFIMFDTTAPSIISALVAVNDDSDKKVNLNLASFYTPEDDVVGYKIYYSESYSTDLTNFILYQTTQNKNITKFQLILPKNNTEYYFAVTAIDEAGNENKNIQAIAKATPTFDITPPSPVSFQISYNNEVNGIKLDWSVYNENDVMSYKIYKSDNFPSTGLTGDLLLTTVSKGNKTYIFNNPSPGAIYYFSVTAIDEMSNETTTPIILSWGFKKLTYTSPISQKIRIFKNGNYAYKGQYISSIENSGSIDLYLFPKKSFLTFSSLNYFNNYTTINAASESTIKTTLNIAIHIDKLLFSSPKIILETLKNNISPFVVDWNNDGKKDIIAGDREGLIYFYKNEGSDNAPILKLSDSIKDIDNHNLSVNGFAKPFVVDWNNDELKDLIIGCANGKIYLSLNNGTDEAPIFTLPTSLKDINGNEITSESYSSPFIIDWDNDNKKDLIIASTGGKIFTYLNKGSDYYPILERAKTSVLFKTTENKSNTSIFIFDWNYSDKKNIVAGELDGYIYTFKNDNDIFTEPTIIKNSKNENINIGNYSHPFVVDWNNDNVPDILAGNEKGQILIISGEKQTPVVNNISSGGGGGGPCIISKLLNNSLSSKINIFKDKYLLTSYVGNFIAKKYYEFLIQYQN